MRRALFVAAATLASLSLAPRASIAQNKQKKRKVEMATKETPERSSLPDLHKWNTTHLYASDDAWQKDRDGLEPAFKAVTACKGKLRKGAATVLGCLERYFDARKRLARLVSYAHRRYDEDTRVSKYQGMKEVIEKVATDFGTASAFIQPELLALPAATLKAMIKDKRFAPYDQFVRDILRLKPHILSPTEESLLAATSLMRDTGYNVYSSFTGADLKFPTIADEEGRQVQLTQALFARYRASADRKVRKAAFDALFSTFGEYKNTLAALLSAQVSANIVYARARKYKTSLEAALDANAIPTAVYRNMVRAANKHLPTLHRYLKLRQKLLGLKDLRYYDMYPPIVAKVELKYPYESAAKILEQAMAPLGKDYVAALAKGLDPASGWIDPFPNKGKRSTAYMDGSAYDVHPYVLGNYLGEYNSLSMLAHEMGHAMHSFHTNKSQPYSKSDYSIFVAEVASTLNEALLMRHALATVKDPKQKLYLLGEQLEGFRQTLFRQAMFAEFELALYERAEKKQPLTADAITKTYLGLLRKYYGHKKGVVAIDDAYGMEWAYIPHFYYDYYVFQYVTGITAATALAELMAKDKEVAAERYVTQLLKAGSSDYPIALLKRAGVDLTTTKPYDIAMSVFARAMGEIDKLVAKKK
jgi:oligoendopeptidase F